MRLLATIPDIFAHETSKKHYCVIAVCMVFHFKKLFLFYFTEMAYEEVHSKLINCMSVCLAIESMHCKIAGGHAMHTT